MFSFRYNYSNQLFRKRKVRRSLSLTDDMTDVLFGVVKREFISDLPFGSIIEKIGLLSVACLTEIASALKLTL